VIEIELPDGTILEAPDGADPSTVAKNFLANRSRTQTREAARAAYADMGTGERLAVGFARPFVELGLGVKDLAVGLSDEDRANLERLEEVSGGAGTVGRVAGELATFMIPGGAATKLASKATKLPRLARFAADAVTSAGVEALKAPSHGESRLEQAAGGAVGAGVGAAAGALLRPVAGLVGGARAMDPAAAALAAQGVRLTPGQRTGGILRAAEDRLRSVPFVGPSIEARTAEGLRAWNKSLLNRAVPEGSVTDAGRTGFREASAAFKSAYGKLWDKDIPLDGASLGGNWLAAVKTAAPKLGPEGTERANAQLGSLLADVNSARGGPVPGAIVSRLDDELRSLATNAARSGDREAAKLYGAARDSLRSALPRDVSEELSRIDGKYRDFATLRGAGSYKTAAEHDSAFTPSQLLASARAADKSKGKAAFVDGRAPMQADAMQGLGVFGKRSLPNQESELINLALAGPGLLAAPFYSRPAVAGQHFVDAQAQRVAELLRTRTPNLRASPALFGAAMEE
jgi:hypothetical protein